MTENVLQFIFVIFALIVGFVIAKAIIKFIISLAWKVIKWVLSIVFAPVRWLFTVVFRWVA